MTGHGKLLKISSLAAMFCGLASLVVGVVLVVRDVTDVDACMTSLEGLLSLVYGVRTAILANVPSNTDKIGKKALILLAAAVAVVAAFVAVKTLSVTPVQIALACVICAIALAAVVLARTIVAEQLRK